MKCLFYFVLFLLVHGCADDSNSNGSPIAEVRKIISTEDTLQIDTLTSSKQEVDTFWQPVEPFDPIQLMVETDLSQNSALQHYLDYIHEEMKLIPNPVRAKYDGTDFGDYFHLTFISEDERYLDFADGNNNFGQYELFDSTTYDQNERYVGKTFDIYWAYKKSLFPCCEGGMDGVVAKVPSITELVLID